MFEGVTLPFTSTDVLTGAMGFLGVVGSLVILGIAVRFTPQILSVVFSALGGRGRRGA